jgi:general secretion pathway protein M
MAGDPAWLTGRRGQALALAITMLLAGIVWVGAVAPLMSWYQDRAATLAERSTLADHMAALAATLPRLQHEAAAEGADPAAAGLTLAGSSDAVAGATLQERVQSMARASGASLSSVETLPAEQMGAWRRIGLHVALTVPWQPLIRLMQAVDTATPRMLVDDLRVHSLVLGDHPSRQPLQTSFTIYAFRPATAGTRTHP